jgi:hypothetical protein
MNLTIDQLEAIKMETQIVNEDKEFDFDDGEFIEHIAEPEKLSKHCKMSIDPNIEDLLKNIKSKMILSDPSWYLVNKIHEYSIPSADKIDGDNQMCRQIKKKLKWDPEDFVPSVINDIQKS